MMILLNLAGALGLFLYGMRVMSDALTELAGPGLRDTLGRLTSNRFKGVLTGVFITCVIQSSSATTLMVVSFVNAGLLSLFGAIAVIMGANIGTTFTAWLIALLGFGISMSKIAIPLMAVGFVLVSMAGERNRKWGRFIIGFCLLFIGLEFMKDAVPDLKDNPAVYAFIEQVSGYGFLSILIFLMLGTALTVVLQSSSATMAITIVAASQGWLPFEAAVAIILGENIGTTITANLGAMVANANARRAALAHLIVNLLGVSWALLLLHPLIGFIDGLALELGGTSPLSSPSAVPLGLALFHSCFNIANTMILIWFVGPLTTLVTRLVTEKPDPEIELTRAKYLSESALKYPETALDAYGKEARRLFENAIFEALAHGMSIHRTQIRSDLHAHQIVDVSKEPFDFEVDSFFERRIEPLFEQLITFATRLNGQHQLTSKQADQLLTLRLSSRRMIDVVKNISVLNALLKRHWSGGSEDFRAEFDSIRVALIHLIRAFGTLRNLPAEERTPERFNQLRTEADTLDATIFDEVDKLIRDKSITPAEGSALINAGAVTRHLTKDFVKAVRGLYGSQVELEAEQIRSDVETAT
jgi:phosphate:Na+ symporter